MTQAIPCLTGEGARAGMRRCRAACLTAGRAGRSAAHFQSRSVGQAATYRPPRGPDPPAPARADGAVVRLAGKLGGTVSRDSGAEDKPVVVIDLDRTAGTDKDTGRSAYSPVPQQRVLGGEPSRRSGVRVG